MCGKFRVAPAMRPAEQAEGLAVPHTQHVLTVLVNYTGLAFTYSDASFQTLIYGAGNSVKDFFLDNSYNGFTVTPAVESYGTANDGIIHVTQPKVHPNHGGASPLPGQRPARSSH